MKFGPWDLLPRPEPAAAATGGGAFAGLLAAFDRRRDGEKGGAAARGPSGGGRSDSSPTCPSSSSSSLRSLASSWSSSLTDDKAPPPRASPPWLYIWPSSSSHVIERNDTTGQLPSNASSSSNGDVLDRSTSSNHSVRRNRSRLSLRSEGSCETIDVDDGAEGGGPSEERSAASVHAAIASQLAAAEGLPVTKMSKRSPPKSRSTRNGEEGRADNDGPMPRPKENAVAAAPSRAGRTNGGRSNACFGGRRDDYSGMNARAVMLAGIGGSGCGGFVSMI